LARNMNICRAHIGKKYEYLKGTYWQYNLRLDTHVHMTIKAISLTLRITEDYRYFKIRL